MVLEEPKQFFESEIAGVAREEFVNDQQHIGLSAISRIIWQAVPGNDQTVSLTNKKTAGSKLDGTS